MKLGIIRLYLGDSGKAGYYNIQEIGLAKALAKRGIITDIFFLVDKKQENKIIINEISNMIRIIYIPANKLFNHGIVSPKFILDYNIDIVHLLSDNQIMVPNFIKFCKKHNIPMYNYIGTINSDTSNKLKKFIMNNIENRNIKFFKKSNIIVKTPDVKKQLEDKGVKNIKFIPVGLDLDIIPKINTDKYSIRKKLNIPLDKKVMIFVGRLEIYKNPIKSIELFNELRKVSNDYFLIIIGKGTLKEKILNLINQYNIKKEVLFIEKIENYKIHEYYRASDIFLNFNSKEIFGMSILEAMYQECNVVAIKAPGPNTIISDKKDGLIMNDYDINKWITVIEKNINNEKMSKLASSKIINIFNWNSIADKYEYLFKNIRN